MQLQNEGKQYEVSLPVMVLALIEYLFSQHLHLWFKGRLTTCIIYLFIYLMVYSVAQYIRIFTFNKQQKNRKFQSKFLIKSQSDEEADTCSADYTFHSSFYAPYK